MSVRRFKAKCRIRRAVLCIVFDGSPSKPAAECRFYDRKKMERWKALRLARSFFFLGETMSDILEAARAFTNLLDIEYQLVLGRKNKIIPISITFNENNFFHLAGLHYLTDRTKILFGDRAILLQKILSNIITINQISSSRCYYEIKERIDYLIYLEQILDDNKTVFKYNPHLEIFSAIQAEFLMKNEVKSRNVFTFLSQDKSTGKYFCRSFFPQTDKDYSIGQTNWTLLYKKKIQKSTGIETVLYDRLKKDF